MFYYPAGSLQDFSDEIDMCIAGLIDNLRDVILTDRVKVRHDVPPFSLVSNVNNLMPINNFTRLFNPLGVLYSVIYEFNKFINRNNEITVYANVRAIQKRQVDFYLRAVNDNRHMELAGQLVEGSLQVLCHESNPARVFVGIVDLSLNFLEESIHEYHRNYENLEGEYFLLNKNVESNLPGWFDRLLDKTHYIDDETLDGILDHVTGYLQKHSNESWQELDTIFAFLSSESNLARIDSTVLFLLLRSCFSVRTKLPNWPKAVAAAYSYFKIRRPNELNGLFWGLMDLPNANNQQ